MKAIWSWIVQAVKDVWTFIWNVLGVLRDKDGKFSHKRLIALAFAVVGIFLLFHGEWWGAGISGAVVAVLAAISAITRT